MEGNTPDASATAANETSGPPEMPARPEPGHRSPDADGPEASAVSPEAKARAAERQAAHRRRKHIRDLADKVTSQEEFQAALLRLAKQNGIELPSATPAPSAPAQAEQTFAGIPETFEIAKGRPGWPSDQRIMAAGELAAQLTALTEAVSKALGPAFDLTRPRSYTIGDKVYTAGGPDQLFQAFASFLAQFDVTSLLATPTGHLVLLLAVSFGFPAAELGGQRLFAWLASRGAR